MRPGKTRLGRIANALFPASLAGGMMYETLRDDFSYATYYLRAAEDFLNAQGLPGPLSPELYSFASLLQNQPALASLPAALGAFYIFRSIWKFEGDLASGRIGPDGRRLPEKAPERIEPVFDVKPGFN